MSFSLPLLLSSSHTYKPTTADRTDREPNIVWSGWDIVPLVKNKPPQRCLLTATARSLTIWDAPLGRSSGQTDSVIELLTITSDRKDDWVHQGVKGNVLLGTLIREPHRLLVALHFPAPDKNQPVSAIVLHHPETLMFQKRIILDGKIINVQRSSHAVVVSTLDPPAIHLFHPATFHTLCPPITFPASYPSSQAPVFTLSHRLLAFATTQPPGPSAPLLQRASGTRTETILHDRPRPSLAHNLPAWGSADSSRSRSGRTDDRVIETEEDPSKIANDDEEGEWTGGTIDRSSSSSSSLADTPDGHIPKSRPIPAPASSSRDRYSTGQHSYQSPQHSFQSRQHAFSSHQHSHQSHPGQQASFPRVEQSVQIIDLHPLSSASVNSTGPNTLSSLPANRSPLVHFYPSPTARSAQPINHLSFSPNSQMLLISQAPSCSFAVVEIRPPRKSPHPAPGHSSGEVWERYVLRRGVSEAVVKSVSWDNAGRWVAVATGKGTLHVYPLNPYGGPPTGHRQGKVLNALDVQPLSTAVQPALRIHQTRQIPPSSTPSPMSIPKVLPPGDCLTPPSSPPFSSSLRKLSQLSASSAAAAPSALLSSTGLKAPNVGDLSLPPVTCCFLAPERVRSVESGRISRPADLSPGRFQHADAVSGPLGLPETAQDILVFYPTVGLLSLQKVLFCPVSLPTSVESTPSVSPTPKSPTGPSSALSLMMMAKKRAEGIVSGSNIGGLEAEVKSWEGAAWELGTVGSEIEDIGLKHFESTQPDGKQGSLAENHKQGLVPWSLSRAEIQTISSSLKILPGPLYLSHQFEFHHLPLPVSPSVHHVFPSLPSTSKLVVRNEVLLTSPSTSPYPFDPVTDGLTPPTSHPSRGNTPVGSHSHSGGSFDRLLEKAIESSLGDPTGRPARPIIPAYPNGDGPTISPRSWKRVPVLMSTTANALGELKREIGERVGSPSGSFSGHSSFSNNNYLLPGTGAASGTANGLSTAVARRFSADKNTRPNGLSFEDETVSDPTEFTLSTLDGPRAGEEGDRWEDEEEGAVERYRRLAEEEDEFDDLVCGVEDWDTDRPPVVDDKVECRSRGQSGF
ncbi:WD40 repeat protein [Phaffia rhodozyma]|uniref:WD40 repeat protein n=1 Tax=Phaffia rhodozyma TaxID=264483 RepID=A0A0F7SE72_PHARH|nr:WD40 repeat protein [Phaffia rhodozyma]